MGSHGVALPTMAPTQERERIVGFTRARMAGAMVGAAMAVALVAGGCGRTGQADVADNGPASSGPPPPKASTAPPTSATPTSRVKATPQCAAISRFKLAQLGATMAPKDKQQQLIDVMNTQSNELRTQLPQFSDAVNQQVLAVRKTLAGTITDEDKRKDKEAQDALGAWFKDNCIEMVGGASTPTTAAGAPTTATTAKPAGASSTTTTAKPATPSTTVKR